MEVNLLVSPNSPRQRPVVDHLVLCQVQVLAGKKKVTSHSGIHQDGYVDGHPFQKCFQRLLGRLHPVSD